MPITTYARDQLLDAVFNADTTGFPAGDPFFQLHSGDPNTTAVSNVVSVARVQAAFPAAASGSLANTANIDFVTMPAVTGNGVIGWSAYDVAGSGLPPTTGNALWWGLFMGSTPKAGVADAGAAEVTSNLFHTGGHGLSTDDRIAFISAPGAPGGDIAGPTLFGTGTGVLYFVLATGLTADVFAVSTSSGGAALDITGDGTLGWIRVVGKTTNSGDTFRIPAASLTAFLEA